MKSKIMIDFGHDYKPVIKITREDSEDVRDRLVNSFFEEWGQETNLLFMAYHSHPTSSGREYTISTMPYDKRFKQFGEEMLNAVVGDGEARAKIQEFFQWFGHRIGYEAYPKSVGGVVNNESVTLDPLSDKLKGMLKTTNSDVYFHQCEYINLIMDWLNGNNEDHFPIWQEVLKYEQVK